MLPLFRWLPGTKRIGTDLANPNDKGKFKAMRPFEVRFDFPVASSNLKISLNATVKLHHSEPYFVVHNFYLANNKNDQSHHSILPDQEIKRIKRDGSFVWVHKDSEKESELSLAIGAGLESILSKEELNELN
jgi:hypothetical protein